MRLMLTLFLLPLMLGCAGDQRNSSRNTFGDLGFKSTQIPLPPKIEPDVSRDDLDSAIRKTRAEFQASQNATTNSLTGLGAQITKVAETLDASVLRLQTELNATFTAAINAHNEMRASVKADIANTMKAEADLRASAIAELDARIDAKFQAQVQALAGIGNRLDSFQQTVGAGRDATVNTNQYADEMFRTSRTSDRTTMWIVIVMALGWIATTEMSRRRADCRLREATGKGEPKCEVGFIRRCWRALW